MEHYLKVLRLEPCNVQGRCNLGLPLGQLKRCTEAKAQLQGVLRTRRDLDDARSAMEMCGGQRAADAVWEAVGRG